MEHTNFVPVLTAADWNAEYQNMQLARRKTDDAAYWDKRAQTFTTKDAPSAYVEAFLERAHIQPDESIFDMGCGTGALALPLARAGHEVLAADFSQGMLNQMIAQAHDEHLSSITPICMSWEDNWHTHGVNKKTYDVALASRSLAVTDLRQALLKLSSVARRRVCITLATGSSPRTDERILREIGLPTLFGKDYQYAFNILTNEGIKAEISYIESTRAYTFNTPDEALEHFSAMAVDASKAIASEREIDRALINLADWLEAELVHNETAGLPNEKGVQQGAWRLRKPRQVTWAFMSWDV